MTVLVAGANGTTGSEVARQLRDAGVGVRTMGRRGEVDVVADLTDPASLMPAVDGVDAVYVATNASPQLAELEGNLARAAVEAGVRHLVKLSVIGAAPDARLSFARLHHTSEQAIAATGIATTFVRPNGFMQNTLAWAAQVRGGAVHGPVIDARWSIVDVRDVAAVAVAAIQDPGSHGGTVRTCTGPEACSPREQIAILAELVERDVRAVELPIPAAVSAMQDAAVPAWAAERLGELFAFYADGLAEPVAPDIERVIGRRPRTYRDFADDHREAFGP